MTTNGKNKKSVENAHHIFGASDINNIPVGITVSQLWAHHYLLDSDIIRDKKKDFSLPMFCIFKQSLMLGRRYQKIPWGIFREERGCERAPYFLDFTRIGFDMVLKRLQDKIVN